MKLIMEFEQYVWSSGPQPHQMDHTLIDDLFFGTFPDGPSLPHTAAEEDTGAGQRIRRVTLTELTDEDTDEDEWLMVSDESGSDSEHLFPNLSQIPHSSQCVLRFWELSTGGPSK